jgi:ribulose-phosphate 3-epimerase
MRELKRMREAAKSSALLEIDGGITEANAASVAAAGADVLVAGNTLFSSEEPRKIVEKFHSL